MMKSIAITGTGIICAIGNDKEQMLDALLNKKIHYEIRNFHG